MSTAVASLSSAELAGTAALPARFVVPAPGFGDMVGSGLAEVNRQLIASQADLQQLAVGDVQNLHQVMIRLEEARFPFLLMLQVRSRLLEVYQDLMRMPV